MPPVAALHSESNFRHVLNTLLLQVIFRRSLMLVIWPYQFIHSPKQIRVMTLVNFHVLVGLLSGPFWKDLFLYTLSWMNHKSNCPFTYFGVAGSFVLTENIDEGDTLKFGSVHPVNYLHFFCCGFVLMRFI